jgi:hypothetical protein
MASRDVPPGDRGGAAGCQDPDELAQRALRTRKVAKAEVADDAVEGVIVEW